MAGRTFFLLVLLPALCWAGPQPRQADLKKDRKWLEKVQAAKERGVSWLLSQQTKSGRFPAFEDTRGTIYELGMHALSMLAVMKSGHPADSRELLAAERALHRLYKKHQFTIKTYEAGIVLMVFEAKAFPFTKKGKKGKKKKKENALPDEDLELVGKLALWLQTKQRAGGMWRYPEDGMDLSNTQYAVLGLWAARNLGIRVDAGVLRRMLETVMLRQQRTGPKMPRLVKSLDPRYGKWTQVGKDRARGWRYMPDSTKTVDGKLKKVHYPFSGSMTSAGVAVLAIGREILGKKDPWLTPQRDRRIRQGIYDGLAWIHKNWDVQDNPGQHGNWPFYWLYGLERCASLTNVENIGPHDWYIEGAERLMADQRENGSWPKTQRMRPPGGANVRWWSDHVDTAFAILFLSRATPHLKIPAPVISPSDD